VSCSKEIRINEGVGKEDERESFNFGIGVGDETAIFGVA